MFIEYEKRAHYFKNTKITMSVITRFVKVCRFCSDIRNCRNVLDFLLLEFLHTYIENCCVRLSFSCTTGRFYTCNLSDEISQFIPCGLHKRGRYFSKYHNTFNHRWSRHDKKNTHTFVCLRAFLLRFTDVSLKSRYSRWCVDNGSHFIVFVLSCE